MSVVEMNDKASLRTLWDALPCLHENRRSPLRNPISRLHDVPFRQDPSEAWANPSQFAASPPLSLISIDKRYRFARQLASGCRENRGIGLCLSRSRGTHHAGAKELRRTGVAGDDLLRNGGSAGGASGGTAEQFQKFPGT